MNDRHNSSTIKRTLASMFALPLIGAALCLGCGTAHADGSGIYIPGVHGPIRGVFSTPNHASAAGHTVVDFYQPVNPKGAYDFEVNPLNNKPSPYLGGTAVLQGGGTMPLDAGVQFEQNVFGQYGIGFSIDISNGTYVNPSIYDNNTGVTSAWRGGSPVGIGNDSRMGHYEGDLGFTIIAAGAKDAQGNALPAGERLYCSNLVQGGGFFYFEDGTNTTPLINSYTKANAAHPIAPWSSRAYNAANQSQASVKHEVAITRDTHISQQSGQSNYDSALDGSWTQISWANCRIDGNAQDVTGIAGSHAWGQSDTKQTSTSTGQDPNNVAYEGRTGYNSPGPNASKSRDCRLPGDVNTVYSTTITEYLRPNTLTDTQVTKQQYNANARATTTAGGSNPDAATRYTNEIVRFNEGTVSQPLGGDLEWEPKTK